MSALQKKIVMMDENLSRILGKKQGSLVSYAELTKGMHNYIKEHGLKKSQGQTISSDKKDKFCFHCGSDLSTNSIFCDKCGEKL